MVNIVEKVLELNASDGEFEILRDAVLTAGLAEALSNPAANLTVFAPTDAAFIDLAQNLGYGDSDESGALGYIVDALTLLGGGDPIPLLQSILTYHVVDGEIFSSALTPAIDGLGLETLQGGTVTVDTVADGPDDNTPGLDDLDVGLPDPTLIGFDVDVDNGVIHVLDGVLLPIAVTEILSQPGTDFIIGDDDRGFYRTGRGDDFIDGNGGRDTILAGSGNDVAIGGSGHDWISGGRGNDTLLGESGRDTIFGGSGNDTITGGAGNDFIISGSGNDTLVFSEGSGHDTVFGFRNGRDKIDLSGYGIEDFSEIADDIRGGFFRTKIELSDDASISLLGTWQGQIDASDFIFAG